MRLFSKPPFPPNTNFFLKIYLKSYNKKTWIQTRSFNFRLFPWWQFSIDTNFVYTIFARPWSDAFLIKKSTASCFESQKTVNTNIITLKMCEMWFVQAKIVCSILIESNLLLWKVLLLIRLVWNFKNLPSKILAVVGRKKPNLNWKGKIKKDWIQDNFFYLTFRDENSVGSVGWSWLGWVMALLVIGEVLPLGGRRPCSHHPRQNNLHSLLHSVSGLWDTMQLIILFLHISQKNYSEN